jgi:putative peptidoglycan lipid II flippase
MQRLFQKLETTVTGGAILIASASLVSRLLGLLRDRLLFSTFGAGDTLDSYYVAFRLPDLIFNILVLGALSSSFIPVFIAHRQKNAATSGEETAWSLAHGVMTITVVTLCVLSGIGMIFTPQLVPLFAPGFTGEKLAHAISLTRIMLFSVALFGISNIMSSILNAMKRFFAFSLAPILYNVGILFGILVLYPLVGLSGLAWGVVLGAFLHACVQVPSVRKLGFRFRWSNGLAHSGVRKVFRLMLPRTIGLSAVQLDQVVSTMIASTLAAGSVAVFSAAQNLQSLPINIFGVSLAISSFPVLSEAFASKQHDRFVAEFSTVFRRILFFIVPVTVLILLLRAHIVRVVLGAGNFDWEDTILTAQSLGFFSLALFAQSLIPMLARSFYALHDTATPAWICMLTVIVNIVGSLWLSSVLGVVGLALSFSITSALQMLLLLIFLRFRLGDLDDNTILLSTIKIVVGSAMMAASVWGALQLLARGVNQTTFIGIFLQGACAAVVGIIVYGCVALAFRFREVELIRQWLSRARSQLLNGRKNS